MAVNVRNKRQFSTETDHLGTYLHPCGDVLVLKLEHRNIPYPNSAVLQKGAVIGKIDEVFGSVSNPYVSVKLENNSAVNNFTVESKFDAYRDKFIPRERFLPREEVERRKEMNDRSANNGRRQGDFKDRKRPGFGQNKFSGRGKGDNSRRESFNRKENGGKDKRPQQQRTGKFTGNKGRSDFRKKS
ncbi:H/ACA ribonucleoprotein complex subunit 1 [Pancytospora epiphaga]|nr:H/ACA ribonucleoprotein complex subunit 1 [Pancytospora epiphaga]